MEPTAEQPVWRPDAPFRHYKVTEQESYATGYQIGMEWDRSWRPGGPWVPRSSTNGHPEWKEHCKKCQQNHDAYLRGFDDAIAKRGYVYPPEHHRNIDGKFVHYRTGAIVLP